MPSSLADELASLSDEDLGAFLATLSDEEADKLAHDWDLYARDNQRLPAGDWFVWLILAGRGFGKTRVGVETIKHWAKSYSRVNLAGATVDDIRDVMIEGESGILAHCSKDERPDWKPSQRKLIWPSGAVSLCFTGQEPDRARGKQSDKLWADEIAAWQYPDTWDQLMFGLRLGNNPQAIVTTTPKPIKIVKDLLAAKNTFVTRGSTYDNRKNLAPQFFDKIITKYEGTRLGRQELDAEVLDDNPSALFHRTNIDANRIHKFPEMARIVVAIDPAATSGEEADDTGIVVAGRDRQRPPHYYVFDDRTCHESPMGWAKIAVGCYRSHKADRIVAEVNNGGEMVEATIRSVDQNVAYKSVHASRGKVIRAEPVSALYEQNRVHHIGFLGALEDECCDFDPATYEPGKSASPNRMDAMVWAITELSESQDAVLDYYASKQADKAKEIAVLPKDCRVWSEPIRQMAMHIKPEVTKEQWVTLEAELQDWIAFCETTGAKENAKFAGKEVERLEKRFAK